MFLRLAAGSSTVVKYLLVLGADPNLGPGIGPDIGNAQDYQVVASSDMSVSCLVHAPVQSGS
jgi:hypothetical protein